MTIKAQATANVTGPISDGIHDWPFAASLQDVANFGYIEVEYLLEGTAKRYRDVDESQSRRDGHWQAEETGSVEFKTRFIVYRPQDPAKFNGTVILTWNNVTAGYDLFGAESLEILEGGYALVCLTTQKAGIEGLPPLHQGLLNWDPERYQGLSIPTDDCSYDVFTQAALAVGAERHSIKNDAIDPMAGLDVQRVVALGASQSAGRLATYINAIQPLTNALDGFILAIYFGRGTPLEVGDVVVNISASDATAPKDRLMGQNLIRDDLGIPIFVVNSELEAMSCFGVRQDDTDTFRYWESAGTCHVSQQVQVTRQAMQERDQIKGRAQPEGINGIPMGLLYDAVFFHMHRWLADHMMPPKQPKLEFTEDGEIIRDENGLALGGIRLPQVEAPLATNSAIPKEEGIFAFLDGSSYPFPAEKVKAMYQDKGAFLSQFESSALKAVEQQVLCPRDVKTLVDEAKVNWPL
jgi:hypothetical protein